jgi:TonB family protein
MKFNFLQLQPHRKVNASQRKIMRKLLFTFILVVLCFVNPTLTQESGNENRYPLRGVFRNQDSAVIPGLQINIDKNGQKWSMFTDINGEFDGLLEPGHYELTVNKTIYEKFIAFIDIVENGLNPNFLEFDVKTSPDFCIESSDNSCPKIIELIKPNYPQAARAVRAMGEVVVGVNVDTAGNVVSAKAESGHPLLRNASEQAALKSKFEPKETPGERKAKLAFVFISSAKEKEIKRYSNPYRVIIIAADATIDTVETK